MLLASYRHWLSDSRQVDSGVKLRQLKSYPYIFICLRFSTQFVATLRLGTENAAFQRLAEPF